MTNEDVLRERLAAAVDETDRMRARVTRLESALRTIADTHGPGTIAGDAAREGMNLNTQEA